jgi:protocatechuate 3,4-dioxygenase beta subunit
MCQHNQKDDDYIHPLQLIQPPQSMNRRTALRAMGTLGAALLLGACNQQLVTSATTTGSNDNSTGSPDGSCSVIPTETEGPYPASSVLTNSSIYRQDIRDAKSGVPLTVVLNLQNINASCAAVSNAAVYIWHCDKDGAYSGYSSSQNGNHAGERFLRGVQVSDTNGQVTFTTIYPGWYAGRITHIHFEVFLNNSLNSSPNKISQVAFPQSITSTVYNSSLYSSRGQNTSVTSFSQDNVFSDGTSYQMASLTGDVSSGYTATLNVGLSV